MSGNSCIVTPIQLLKEGTINGAAEVTTIYKRGLPVTGGITKGMQRTRN